MRVGGGSRKGQRLYYPAKGLRPTKDVVKQAIINILQPWMPGAHVLDLFAGAGALGLECLSSGAFVALFVERDRRTVRLLKLNGLLFGDRVEVIAADALKGMSRLAGRKFEIIIADPPYEQGLDSTTLDAVARHDLLVADGVMILEHGKRDKPVLPAGLELVNQHKFGDTIVSVIVPRLRQMKPQTTADGRIHHEEWKGKHEDCSLSG
jgi:16S rRNA (guanine966-N2)-methyltransferase